MSSPSTLRRVLPYAVTLAVTGLLWVAATRIEVGTAGRVGPDLWPKAILGFLALLCIFEIARRVMTRDSEGAQGLVVMDAAPAPERTDARMLASGIALVAAFVVGVPWLGFFTATVLFLACFMWVGGFRRKRTIAVTSLVGALALVVIFMRIAYISLPLGEGPFRSLSLALLRAIGVS